jgi:hypothetical protein
MIICSLKRYLVREIYRAIMTDLNTFNPPRLTSMRSINRAVAGEEDSAGVELGDSESIHDQRGGTRDPPRRHGRGRPLMILLPGLGMPGNCQGWGR